MFGQHLLVTLSDVGFTYLPGSFLIKLGLGHSLAQLAHTGSLLLHGFILADHTAKRGKQDHAEDLTGSDAVTEET